MLIIKTILNTPIAAQYPIRKDFMNFMCKAAFAHKRGLWMGGMLETPSLDTDPELGGLLQAMVYADISQANASFDDTIKARELLQSVANDNDPSHFKRRVIALSDQHAGMGHPVYFVENGLKLIKIDEEVLLELTPWEHFIAEFESIIQESNGSWEFYDQIAELWQRSSYNRGAAMLQNVDWHESSRTLEAAPTNEEFTFLMTALGVRQPGYLPQRDSLRDPNIITPMPSPNQDAFEQREQQMRAIHK
jgi:hypothetical protein